ncbi:MAG: YHS domain-containing protein [Ferruginibacter sp.]
MNKKIITASLVLLLLLGCGSNKTDSNAPAAGSAKNSTHTMMPPPHEKKFAGTAFANTKDYICGMPVTAGIEDTVTYKGKLYGFCSKECKDEFSKSPDQYLTVSK